jgi:putative acetyltransferase
MSILLRETRADHPDAVALITELTAILSADYPPQNVFGFSVEKMLREGVYFVIAYADEVPAGCGGVLLVDDEYAEIKRMYVRPTFRGMGIAKQVIAHVEAYSRAHGITRMRLETGTLQHEAIRLYERMGYAHIPPFGAYVGSITSVCMEKVLA